MKIVVNDWIPSDGTMYQFAEPTGMPFSLAYGEGVAQDDPLVRCSKCHRPTVDVEGKCCVDCKVKGRV